jgi:N-acyl-L-homoserine lactone synthetase
MENLLHQRKAQHLDHTGADRKQNKFDRTKQFLPCVGHLFHLSVNISDHSGKFNLFITFLTKSQTVMYFRWFHCGAQRATPSPAMNNRSIIASCFPDDRSE